MKYQVVSLGKDWNGNIKKAITIKEGKTYYLIGTATKRDRWTQGGFMGGSRSRPVTMWDVVLYASTYMPLGEPYTHRYGETDYIDGYRVQEEAEKIFKKYKNQLLTANSVKALKELTI
jgi:hypothetical protein